MCWRPQSGFDRNYAYYWTASYSNNTNNKHNT